MLVLALLVAAVAALRGMWSPCGLSMLTSLNPVAERARGHRPALTAAWYVLGAAVGGAALGAGCAAAAFGLRALALSPAVTFGVAAGCAGSAVISDLRLFGRSLPEHPRQVNEQWLVDYRRWIYASGYGLQIGAGFATYIMTAGVYLTAALAILSGPRGALLTGLCFGVVRGLTVLVAAPATTPRRLRTLLRRVDGLAAGSLTTVAAVNAAVAAAAAALAGGPGIGGAAAAALAAAALGPVLMRRWAIVTPRR
jgi:hypothetical protein